MPTIQEITEMSNDEVFENLDDSTVIEDPAAESGEETTPPDAEGEAVDDDNQAEQEQSEGTEEAETETVEEESELEEVTVADLQTKLSEMEAQLEKERKGLLYGIQEERGKRQQLEGKLSQVSEFIANRKANATESDEDDQEAGAEDAADTVSDDRIEIAYDDDGNAFVPGDVVKKLTAKQTQELQSEIDNLNAQLSQKEAATAQQNALNNVLAQDESYPAALALSHEQSQYFDKVITEHFDSNHLQRPGNLMEIIDAYYQIPELGKAFSAKYPDADAEVVLEGLFSGSHAKFVKMLKRNADNGGNDKTVPPAKGGKEKMNTLKQLAGKPSNLSGTQNQRSDAGGMTLDMFANLSQEEFDNLSQADIDRIDKKLSGG